ncbi:MAG: hypothetical protein LBQ66_14195 [Planctomycetaceae bacterium]|jgi:hypothetical protein|nr:hypothetical protein [Planctomycetaceae bacterium]
MVTCLALGGVDFFVEICDDFRPSDFFACCDLGVLLWLLFGGVELQWA